jgi:hypothetical protein
MNPIKIDRFNGILPRIPASLLPEGHAAAAQNCDFAYGELRPTRQDGLIRNMDTAPIGSVYTDDGLVFFTWPGDVNAVRSPLANDRFNRLYYTTGTDFRVTSRSGMRPTGGAPDSSYRVGVPRPTLPPLLASANPSPLNAVIITFTFHYEAAGVKYQEGVFIPEIVTALRQWRFTPPAKAFTLPRRDPASGEYPPTPTFETPAQAVPVVRLSAKSQLDDSVVLDLYSSNSSLASTSAWTLVLGKTGNGNDYTLDLAPNNSAAEQEARSYVYTFVNTYDEEGPPSPPANLTHALLAPVQLTAYSAGFGGEFAPLKEIRLYRTASGAAEHVAYSADYFLVTTVPVLAQAASEWAFLDDVPASGLNEALASLDYYPPDPHLTGLCCLPNGILMAWRGNELHFSDAYQPWSWPPAYVLTFGDANVVGAIASGNGALITTTGKPYRIAGISPDAMTPTSLNVLQAGVSKWSIADLNGMLVYASHDGLVVFDGNQPSLALSNRYFTRDVWRARYANGLASMRFAVWDGRLLVYSGGVAASAAFVPFMLSLDEAQGAMTDLPGLTAQCSFISPLVDQCYLVRAAGVYQFAGGEAATASWTSREWVSNRPLNYGVMQVLGSGQWSLSLWGDGVLRHRQDNLFGDREAGHGTARTFRLPDGYLAERWQVTVQGQGVLREVRIAQTASELAGY